MDISSFNPVTEGLYNFLIDGFGIGDPFHLDNASCAVACGYHHEGTYNQRLGIALTASPTYTRGTALEDGVNGCTNYWSDLPSICASE